MRRCRTVNCHLQLSAISYCEAKTVLAHMVQSQWQPQCPEIQDVEAPVSTFVFRDVRRRLAEPLGSHCLTEPGCLSARHQQFAQPLVAYGVNGLDLETH